MKTDTPSQTNTSFHKVSRARNGEYATKQTELGDPLRRIAKSQFTGCQSIDMFSKIIKENPDISFKNVTIWHNGYLDILLSQPTEVDIVLVDGVGYRMLPYWSKPVKCAKCQRLGHNIKRCRSTQEHPICFRCGSSHPKRDPSDPCKLTVRCANCKGSYHTHDKECPEYKKAVHILATKIQTEKQKKVDHQGGHVTTFVNSTNVKLKIDR